MNKITGSCHCKKNTFEVNGESEFQFVCYCTDCRVLNSGGHLCGIMVSDENLTKATATQSYSYMGGTGNPLILHFCPTCSTQLYGYPTAYPNKVVLRANVLVNAGFKPQQNIFTESAFVWDKVEVLS